MSPNYAAVKQAKEVYAEVKEYEKHFTIKDIRMTEAEQFMRRLAMVSGGANAELPNSIKNEKKFTPKQAQSLLVGHTTGRGGVLDSSELPLLSYTFKDGSCAYFDVEFFKSIKP